MSSQREPYDGLERKLVIAFDVGTTFSGASYVFLLPKETPLIQGVTKYIGQTTSGGGKIPSIVCYDSDGTVVGVGPETDVDTNPELLEVEGLVRVEWFKLHLRPQHLVTEQGFTDKDLPVLQLPKNKTVIDVFSDMLSYMYRSTKQYIRERQGDDILKSVENNVEFILSHPNGWEGDQQSQMRRAAITAGLVNESEARTQISFVTEGEASLHFCLNQIPGTIEKYADAGILVADCGGGTVDISSYARSSGAPGAVNTSGFKFKEIARTECLLQGSVFVTRRAEAFLTEKLSGAKYGTKSDIEVMTRNFDKTTKINYKSASKYSYIRFGRDENDPLHGILSGGIKLNSADVAGFFEPAVQGIINSIEEQCQKTSTKKIGAVFMVGGFSTSNYLFSKLVEHFSAKGIDVMRPDDYMSKAVAEGAVIYKIDHVVASRISKYAYGIECCTVFDSSRADHLARKKNRFEAPSGQMSISGCFKTILKKETEVEEVTEFRASFAFILPNSAFNFLKTKSVEIKCYRNRKGDAPTWIDADSERFIDLCEVTADLTEVKSSIKPQYNSSNGTKFYTLQFDVVLLFGLTELQAQIAWIEDGVEKRGPASTVYDPDTILNIS